MGLLEEIEVVFEGSDFVRVVYSVGVFDSWV